MKPLLITLLILTHALMLALLLRHLRHWLKQRRHFEPDLRTIGRDAALSEALHGRLCREGEERRAESGGRRAKGEESSPWTLDDVHLDYLAFDPCTKQIVRPRLKHAEAEAPLVRLVFEHGTADINPEVLESITPGQRVLGALFILLFGLMLAACFSDL